MKWIVVCLAVLHLSASPSSKNDTPSALLKTIFSLLDSQDFEELQAKYVISKESWFENWKNAGQPETKLEQSYADWEKRFGSRFYDIVRQASRYKINWKKVKIVLIKPDSKFDKTDIGGEDLGAIIIYKKQHYETNRVTIEWTDDGWKLRDFFNDIRPINEEKVARRRAQFDKRYPKE